MSKGVQYKVITSVIRKKISEEAIYSLWSKNRIIIYSCTSGYPVPFNDVCLLEILDIKNKFGDRVKVEETLYVFTSIYPNIYKPIIDLAKHYISINDNQFAMKILTNISNTNNKELEKTIEELVKIIK